MNHYQAIIDLNGDLCLDTGRHRAIEADQSL